MAVERTRWSEERLDDLAARMNDQYTELVAKLDRLDNRFDRIEDRFERLDSKVDGLRGEFYDTRRWVLAMWLGFAALFVEIALFR
jgi:tetrahydromethanopterin S-methyltransferase subunit G